MILCLGVVGVAIFGLVMVPKDNKAEDGWNVVEVDKAQINQVCSYFYVGCKQD